MGHVALPRQHGGEWSVLLVALHLGDVFGAVHVQEVRRINAVLGHLLRHRLDHIRRAVEVAPCRIADLLDDRDLPLGFNTVRMPPREHHAVAHHHGVGGELRLPILPIGVRDVGAGAGAVEGPAVEGTLEVGTADFPTDTEVRTQVRAIGVLQVELPAVLAPKHEFGAPVLQCRDLAGREFVGVRNHEPAERVGKREPGHREPSWRIRTDSNFTGPSLHTDGDQARTSARPTTRPSSIDR